MKVKVYHNGDDVFITWKPVGFIPDCRGFGLLRRRNSVEEVVSTWVGFEGQEHEEGERRASTNWPIQKYQWTDYMANPGDRVAYRVLAMVGPDKNNLHPDPKNSSKWTKEIRLTPQTGQGIEVYFNRGIIASQWIARRLGITAEDLQSKKLRKAIETPGDSLRSFLSGPLGARLFELLHSAANQEREVYAVLYELDDEELESALEKFGKRAHVVLANGSVKTKGKDQNKAARARLQNKIDLHDRMISPKALGHNKFLVICDSQNKPRWVWTGSQNWTKTGLCTQANNSVLIDNFDLAAEYRVQWDRLRDASAETPDALKTSNSKFREFKSGKTSVRLWFTPTVGLVALKNARKIIEEAKQGILFLMFNPGPKDTLLNEIIETAQTAKKDKPLYIRGAINQDPSTTKNPVALFEKNKLEDIDFDISLPAAIDEPTEWFRKELQKLPSTFAMIHSKVVLVDPFTKHPTLITGSHNLGPKASSINDENLLIIYDAPKLAAAYAANIMAIYNQYRWRFRRHKQSKGKRWNGLRDADSWQYGYLKAGSAALREINFWVGE